MIKLIDNKCPLCNNDLVKAYWSNDSNICNNCFIICSEHEIRFFTNKNYSGWVYRIELKTQKLFDGESIFKEDSYDISQYKDLKEVVNFIKKIKVFQ